MKYPLDATPMSMPMMHPMKPPLAIRGGTWQPRWGDIMDTTFVPIHLERWTKPDHYAGASWPEYYGSGTGQHRDSDALSRSNFRCMLRALGGESDTVMVIREGHWAVGWVEWIAIHESDHASLRTADNIMDKLQDYPVVNEEDWSALEDEEAQEVWTKCYSDKDRLDYIRRHRSEFDFYDYADLIASVRGKYFRGYASTLLG